MEPPMRRFGVGYALAEKKVRSFIQPSLVSLAGDRGIDLVRIDTARPLADQGPFDCILHKMSGEGWRAELEEYAAANPGVPIIDPPDAIERLHNRISMLQAVSDLEAGAAAAAAGAGPSPSFGIPKQVVVDDMRRLLNGGDCGLAFPVIAKPLVADGSAGSHKMSLVFNHEGLSELRARPPVVLQEFVNHGGVIFKVYVVGEHVKCVVRKSLPDVTEERLGGLEGSLSFSQVSNIATGEKGDDKYCKMMNLEDTEMPPQSFIAGIACGLRRAMKLRLFNFDVIRDARVGNRYLIIDINYFPGYAKMPSYETVLTDFLWNVLNEKETGSDCLIGSDREARKLVGNNGCDEEKENPICISDTH